jgi:hypothetical protein
VSSPTVPQIVHVAPSEFTGAVAALEGKASDPRIAMAKASGQSFTFLKMAPLVQFDELPFLPAQS